MVGIFKQKNPGNALLLLIYGLVIKFPLFLSPAFPRLRQEDGFLYRRLVEWLGGDGTNPMVFSVIAFLLLFTQASHINKIGNDHRLMPRSNYLAGMSYFLITSLFPEWSQFSAGLIVNSLLIWAAVKMMALYNSNAPKTQLFNIGILVGLSSFLFFPAAAFVVLVFFALLLMRPFRISEWVVTLMGLLTPYYFLFIVLFLTQNWNPGAYMPHISLSIMHFKPSVWVATSITIMIIPFLAGGYFIQNNLGKMLIQTRKCWSLLLFYLLVSSFIPFINSTDDFINWVLCTVPFAFFHAAAYFYSQNSWFPALLHWVSFGVAIYLNYFVR